MYVSIYPLAFVLVFSLVLLSFVAFYYVYGKFTCILLKHYRHICEIIMLIVDNNLTEVQWNLNRIVTEKQDSYYFKRANINSVKCTIM